MEEKNDRCCYTKCNKKATCGLWIPREGRWFARHCTGHFREVLSVFAKHRQRKKILKELDAREPEEERRTVVISV